MSEPRRAAFVAVVLIVSGMGFIVVVGGVTLALISPEFVASTWAGLTGEGNRPGILLFGVQLAAFAALTVGLLVWGWRRGRT